MLSAKSKIQRKFAGKNNKQQHEAQNGQFTFIYYTGGVFVLMDDTYSYKMITWI